MSADWQITVLWLAIASLVGVTQFHLPSYALAQSLDAKNIAGGIAPTRHADSSLTTWSRFGLDFDIASDGTLGVAYVAGDTSAAASGLLPGDRVMTIDGFAFPSPPQIFAYLGGRAGQKVRWELMRRDKPLAAEMSVPVAPLKLAWLGVYLAGSEPKRAGAAIVRVHPDSPAARAGLAAGDVVRAVDGVEVIGSAGLILAIEELKPGAKAELTLTRGPNQLTRPVQLAARPTSNDNAQAAASLAAANPRTVHYGWR